jgi:O-Antigen ligase/Tetratricopeptide repeat
MASGRQLVKPLLIAALAAGVFWIAYDDGSYGLTSRNSIAVIVLWGLVLASAAGFWPAARIPGSALIAGGLLAVFAIWTGLSALWAASPEKAFNEFDRVVLFLAIFALAVVASPRGSARRWLAGLAIGLTSVALLALVSRLFPHLFDASTDLAEAFPSARKRLSFPVDYWNGLATIVAFAIPALLYFAAEARAVVRGLAVAPLPALVATLYLTSSRGGWVAAAIAVVVLLALTSRRWATAGALAVGGAASAGAVAVLLARDELVDTPLTASVAESQGRSAALLIGLLCLAAGAAYGLLATVLPAPPRASRTAATAFAVVLVVLGLAAVAAANPVERYDNFKEIPPELQGASVQEHLFSTSGNGRWQWWSSAVDEFQTKPLTGRGAGSYEAWWAEHASIAAFVRDAHSLYLETLGELGVIGLVLLLAFIIACLVAGARRLGGRTESERAAVATLFALVAAFLFEAGIDWMWEVTAVSVVAVLALGLLAGPATEPEFTASHALEARRPKNLPLLRVAAAAIAFGLIVAEAIPLLATMEVRKSQEAVAAGNLADALDQAESARSIQPWAASPYLQIALVQELGGRIDEARTSIETALEKDQEDWRLWLLAARIQTKAGAIAEARQSLAKAEELNPKSDLFSTD